MVFFSFISTILYFETIFDYAVTMPDIDNCLGDSVLVGSSYKMMGGRTYF